jgi:hypothetical protein
MPRLQELRGVSALMRQLGSSHALSLDLVIVEVNVDGSQSDAKESCRTPRSIPRQWFVITVGTSLSCVPDIGIAAGLFRDCSASNCKDQKVTQNDPAAAHV